MNPHHSKLTSLALNNRVETEQPDFVSYKLGREHLRRQYFGLMCCTRRFNKKKYKVIDERNPFTFIGLHMIHLKQNAFTPFISPNHQLKYSK